MKANIYTEPTILATLSILYLLSCNLYNTLDVTIIIIIPISQV